MAFPSEPVVPPVNPVVSPLAFALALEKWKAAGRSTAMTLMVSSDEFSCVAPVDQSVSQGRLFHLFRGNEGTHWRRNPVQSILGHRQRNTFQGQGLKMHQHQSPVLNGNGCSRKLLRIDPTTIKQGKLVRLTRDPRRFRSRSRDRRVLHE
jgi:hypothetical protein